MRRKLLSQLLSGAAIALMLTASPTFTSQAQAPAPSPAAAAQRDLRPVPTDAEAASFKLENVRDQVLAAIGAVHGAKSTVPATRKTT